jgi:hypothetical protein
VARCRRIRARARAVRKQCVAANLLALYAHSPATIVQWTRMSRICAAGTVSTSRSSSAKFAALQLNRRRVLPHRARCVGRAGIRDGFARHFPVRIRHALIAARSVFGLHIQRSKSSTSSASASDGNPGHTQAATATGRGCGSERSRPCRRAVPPPRVLSLRV